MFSIPRMGVLLPIYFHLLMLQHFSIELGNIDLVYVILTYFILRLNK